MANTEQCCLYLNPHADAEGSTNTLCGSSKPVTPAQYSAMHDQGSWSFSSICFACSEERAEILLLVATNKMWSLEEGAN